MTKKTDNEFDFIEEYDTEIAKEGRWFPATNRNGVQLGLFKCKLMDSEMPAVKVYQQRQGQKGQSTEQKSEEEQIEDTIRMFIHCSLIDWEIKGKNGENIPFDKKSAHAFFSNKTTHSALVGLIQKSSTTANYLSDEEEPEKN